jgi:hypothetical protein
LPAPLCRMEAAVTYLRTQKLTAVWDYCVCAVHYDPGRASRIASVRVQRHLGDRLGAVEEMSREEVLRRLGRAETFVTIYEVRGEWRYGAQVIAQQHGGTGLGGQPFYFLRTVADGVRADNLGDLPTY